MVKMVKKFYSTLAAAKLSGLEMTMVDYLCREKILMPSANAKRCRGKPRRYTFGDIVILRAIYQLLKRGISVARLKGSLNTMRKQYKNIKPGVALKKYLVTDGKSLYFKDSKDYLVDLTSDCQHSFLFVLDVDQLSKELEHETNSLSQNLKIYVN